MTVGDLREVLAAMDDNADVYVFADRRVYLAREVDIDGNGDLGIYL